jgi:hypothetical protein
MSMQPRSEPVVFPSPAARRALLLGSAIGLGRPPLLSSEQRERPAPIALLVVGALLLLGLVALS